MATPTSILQLGILVFGPRWNFGKIFVDYEQFCPDLAVDSDCFRDSALGSGGYYLFTCPEHGIPEVAGLHEPVFVAHRRHEVVWECSATYYPAVGPTRPDEYGTLRYVFDRREYVQSVRTMLDIVNAQPSVVAGRVWYPGTERKDAVERGVEYRAPRTPFSPGSTLVVGLDDSRRAADLWVEGNKWIYPFALLPTRDLWLRFDRWSEMFRSLRPPIIDPAAYELAEGVTLEEATAQAESLAAALEAFWATKVRVEVPPARASLGRAPAW